MQFQSGLYSLHGANEFDLGLFRHHAYQIDRYFRPRINPFKAFGNLLFQNVVIPHPVGGITRIGAVTCGIELCGRTRV